MDGFPFFYSPFAPMIVGFFTIVFMAAALVVILKGYSLWCAARGGQKWWFIALLLINTLGVLEIVYLIWFRPKQNGGTVKKEAAETPVTVSSSAP